MIGRRLPAILLWCWCSMRAQQRRISLLRCLSSQRNLRAVMVPTTVESWVVKRLVTRVSFSTKLHVYNQSCNSRSLQLAFAQKRWTDCALCVFQYQILRKQRRIMYILRVIFYKKLVKKDVHNTAGFTTFTTSDGPHLSGQPVLKTRICELYCHLSFGGDNGSIADCFA